MSDTPHWHEHNPWKHDVIYVTVEELAACTQRMHGPDNLIPVKDRWDMDASNAE